MKLTSDSIAPGERVPERFAMGKAHPDTHATFSDNVSPHLAWSDAPEGTRSFAIVVLDTEVPTVNDFVNQEGKTLPADMPRTIFYHWILIDIPADVREIPEGAHSEGVVRGGKAGPEAPGGTRHGVNNYREFFATDEELAGDYHGYDGPFPPWNDERVHNYVFTVYALDVEKLEIDGSFDGPTARAAMQGHVLESASFAAHYSLNQ